MGDTKPREFRHPILELTVVRFREFLREKGAVFWAFGFPILLAAALGIAFRERTSPPPLLALDDSAPAWIAEAAEDAAGAGELELLRGSVADVQGLVDRGAVDVSIVDAGRDDGGFRWGYAFDPVRDGAAGQVALIDSALQRRLGRADVARTERVALKAGGRYVDFLFPGVLGMTLMSSSIWGIGYTLVLHRRRRQLEQLAATPMKRWHYMLAMFLARGILLGGEVVALVGVGYLFFDVSVRGDLFSLFLIALSGAAAFAGLALVAIARVESIEAANGFLNLITLPMWMLSGVFFSYERFPEFSHAFIQALPLTALNDAMRSVINDGGSLADNWQRLAILLAWALVTFPLAAKRFRWM
jgi:ABC-2 type transport system permease protein